MSDSITELKGQCYEIDNETFGKKYYKKVRAKYCKPDDNLLKTMWRQNSDKPGGKCYLIDSQTNGSLYVEKLSKEKCSPVESDFSIIEGHCYQHGLRKDGGSYLVRVAKKTCEPINQKPVFVLRDNGVSGDCVVIAVSTKEIFKKKLSDCKPSDVIFKFVSVKGNGKCFEVSRNGGAQRFIREVSIKKCEPGDTFYTWSQLSIDSGQCELRSLSDLNFIIPAQMSKCDQLFKTTTSFEVDSRIKGRCYIIDVDSNGRKFKHITTKKHCLPRKTQNTLITWRGKKYCLKKDSSYLNTGYRETIARSYCHENIKNYKWRLSLKEVTKGHCYQKYKIGYTEKEKLTVNINCKPDKTKFQWIATDQKEPHKASCYEIASEGGVNKYINKVNKKKCPQDSELILKYFHPSQYKFSGCYLVSIVKGEIIYGKKTKDEKCKETL
jgi:hypothetical protein